jgi:hypothetical protein
MRFVARLFFLYGALLLAPQFLFADDTQVGLGLALGQPLGASASVIFHPNLKLASGIQNCF